MAVIYSLWMIDALLESPISKLYYSGMLVTTFMILVIPALLIMHAWLSGILGESLPYTEENLGLQYISEEQATISTWMACSWYQAGKLDSNSVHGGARSCSEHNSTGLYIHAWHHAHATSMSMWLHIADNCTWQATSNSLCDHEIGNHDGLSGYPYTCISLKPCIPEPDVHYPEVMQTHICKINPWVAILQVTYQSLAWIWCRSYSAKPS